MRRLWLYTTRGCHLCEQLEARLVPLLAPDVGLERVEVAEDDQLVERYGQRIPVLRDEAGAEFAKDKQGEMLKEWLEQRKLAARNDDEKGRETPEPEREPATKRGGRRVLG